MPPRPQPMPNMAAPQTSSALISRRVGTLNFSRNTGLPPPRRIMLKVTMLTPTAPPITNMRLGSQPRTPGQRKSMTLSCWTMPLRPMATAKSAPNPAAENTSGVVVAPPAGTENCDTNDAARLATAKRLTMAWPLGTKPLLQEAPSEVNTSWLMKGTFLIIAFVAAPVDMKVMTATKDRGLRRGRPHTPWPLVQPDPITVP
mmetsp:Transcript_30354/g.71317  ORF Transcript_30354/g.71317 Transcript_30354/m.71317 type:complete len:201 (-) Transcript_30354:60-662(-)